jgi:hypothetical protein
VQDRQADCAVAKKYAVGRAFTLRFCAPHFLEIECLFVKFCGGKGSSEAIAIWRSFGMIGILFLSSSLASSLDKDRIAESNCFPRMHRQ